MRSAVMRLFFLFLFVFVGIVDGFSQEKGDALQEYRLGRFDSAVEICLSEIAATPTNMDSYVVLCWSLVKLGRYEEASVYATKGREINRYDPRIVETLAEAKYHQGRNAEALRLFQDYVTLAPEGARIDTVYYYMGELFIRLGRFQHADIALSTAVRYVPGDATWWTRLGYAREKAGDFRFAVAAYEQALSLNPQMTDAQRGLERSRGALPNR